MSCRIFTVLRSGGEYDARHLFWFQRMAGKKIYCLTDMAIASSEIETIPLLHDWPGWWSKIELFRPDIKGDILYLDLDTVIRKPIDGYMNLDNNTFLIDAYRFKAGKINSGMMYLKDDERNAPYRDMVKAPEMVMRLYRGDQDFLDTYFRTDCNYWQERFPGQIKSYKCDKLNGDETVVYFHGKPRPWEVQHDWIAPL